MSPRLPLTVDDSRGTVNKCYMWFFKVSHLNKTHARLNCCLCTWNTMLHSGFVQVAEKRWQWLTLGKVAELPFLELMFGTSSKHRTMYNAHTEKGKPTWYGLNMQKNKSRDLDQRASGAFQSLNHDYMHRMREKRVGTIVVNVTLRNQKYVQSGFQQK